MVVDITVHEAIKTLETMLSGIESKQYVNDAERQFAQAVVIESLKMAIEKLKDD